MKNLIVIAAIVALLSGCVTQQKPALSSSTDPRIGELTITSARFGNGKDVADVTGRVVELLHSEPDGFAANVDRMRVDPRPYKAKTLVITYDYKGVQHIFAVISPDKVSYELLLETAKK